MLLVYEKVKLTLVSQQHVCLCVVKLIVLLVPFYQSPKSYLTILGILRGFDSSLFNCNCTHNVIRTEIKIAQIERHLKKQFTLV